MKKFHIYKKKTKYSQILHIILNNLNYKKKLLINFKKI